MFGVSIVSPALSAPTDYDVCILGAGIAGITAALALARLRPDYRIALVESGAQTANAYYQSLCEGEIRTPALDENEAPARSRIRALGGTSAYWGGYLSPLSAEALEARPWEPASGWPITRAELDPFYDQAAGYFQVEPFAAVEQSLQNSGHVARFRQDSLTQKVWQIRAINFGSVYKDSLQRSPQIDLYLQTTCIGFELDGNGSIRGARCVSDGTEYRFRARDFAIAMGGLENARFLLNACADEPGLLPRSRHNVGRYFSIHPTLPWGRAILTDALAESALYAQGLRLPEFPSPLFAFLNVPRAVRAQHRWLNAFFDLSEPARPEDSPGPGHEIVGRLVSERHSLVRNVAIMSEMSARFENHVGLAQARDPLGLRRLYIDLRLTVQELNAVREQLIYLGQQLGAHGFGRVWVNEDLIQGTMRGESRFWGGHHHMCTTRMSASPDDGVVNSDCRFHEHENLYALGSSVFRGSATVNPTFTIGALAIRLAHHLGRTQASATKGAA